MGHCLLRTRFLVDLLWIVGPLDGGQLLCSGLVLQALEVLQIIRVHAFQTPPLRIAPVQTACVCRRGGGPLTVILNELSERLDLILCGRRVAAAGG